MTTGIASGLGATFGVIQEVTVGDYLAPTRWIPFLSEDFKGDKRIAQGEALYGQAIQLAGHRVVVGLEAKGTAVFELQDRQLGLLIKNMLGITPTTVTTAGVTTQTFTGYGNPTGMGLSVQIGRPETTGTIAPFSYAGCKIVDWEISVATGQIPKLSLTMDGWSEVTTTALTAPSLVTSNVFSFAGGNFLVAGSTPVGVVKSVSIKGAWTLDVDRFQIGSTTKSEQLVNGWLKLTTTADVEFANLTDIYDLYAADTQSTLELEFTGPAVSGTATSGFTMSLPASFADQGPPNVPDPKVLVQKTSWTTLNDGSDAPVSATYIGLDSAA